MQETPRQWNSTAGIIFIPVPKKSFRFQEIFLPEVDIIGLIHYNYHIIFKVSYYRIFEYKINP